MLLENIPILDIYADDVGEVEILGSNVRVVFFTWNHQERAVVAKIVLPRSAIRGHLPDMVAEAARKSFAVVHGH